MTSSARAQRLVDEFEEGAASVVNHSARHGIAAVLRHLADTEDDISHDLLNDMSDALTAPSPLDRALSGDSKAAQQFPREAGFTDGEIQGLKDGFKSIFLDNTPLQNPDGSFNFQSGLVNMLSTLAPTSEEN